MYPGYNLLTLNLSQLHLIRFSTKINFSRPITQVASDTHGQLLVAGDSLGFVYCYYSVLGRVKCCHRLESCITALAVVDEDENTSGVNLVAATSHENCLHFLSKSA